jgi:Protein of unknown function (DUF4089)
MAGRRDEAAALIDAMAPVVGITVMPEWREAVIGFIDMARAAADQFVDLPLDDAEDEAAPVFRPGEPR